jgi:hypothetical protein
MRVTAVLCLLSVCLIAQVDRSALNGTVTDESGAPVKGAIIKVKEKSTGLERETISGDGGSYSLSALPPGTYKVRFSMPGFAVTKYDDVLQTVGGTRTLNAHLQVAQTSQTVEVNASAALDNTTATVGGSVEQEQVNKVPLNGRNWTTLTLLVPGAVDTGSGNQKSIRFNGQGNDDNNFRLDGNDFSGIQNAAPKSALRLQISTEAIQEFIVNTANYTADNGGSAGAQVNVVSKSGTNDWHGALFEYLRNSAFDARSPFNPSPAAQPPFRLNQFGADLGGPIARDKTFFFANFEGFRQSLGLTQVGYVPTGAFRAQTVAAQPGFASILNAFPIGNGPVSPRAPQAQLWTGTTSSPVTENAGLIRLDHRFSDRDTAYVRYNADDGLATSPLGSLNAASTVHARLQNAMVEELHVFSPTLLNEFRVGFNRNYYNQSQQTGLPYNFVIPNFAQLYEDYNKTQASTSYDTRDDVTKTYGRHTVKAGVEIRRVQVNEGNSNDGTVTWGPNLTNFLANQLTTFSDTATLPTKGLRKTQYFGYVQDEWKLKPNLTLTGGVRYSFFGPFYEVNNRAYPFDVYSCGGYCARGGQFTNPNYLNFDPRTSIAWSPAGHSNTVLRAGFGMFHGEIQLGDQDSPAVNDEPSILLQTGKTVTYAFPVNPALIPTTGLAATPRSMLLHHPDSYVSEWTASVQQLLPGQIVVTGTYLGEKGTHLFQRTYTNLLNPLTGIRPLAAEGFPSQIDTKTQEGNSTFQALQLSAKRTFKNGLFLDANYSWSHAIDDDSVGAGDANAAENVNCFRCDKASSDFDVRHTGNISMTYQLPFGQGRRFFTGGRFTNLVFGGWEFTDLFTARSGLPLNVTVSRSGSALPDGNNVNQRPNLVPGVSIYPANQGPGNWLNPAAFAVPAAGTWGNAGRNIARGPGLWQDDVALNKSFTLTERFLLNFRAEAFNVFNRAQYGNPGSSISSASSFGVITSLVNSQGLTGVGTPRQLQFALRLSF